MKLLMFLPIVLISLFAGFTATAQEGGTLTGSLYDQKEESIPFATVAMMKLPDSTIVTGTTTDVDGRFGLKAPGEGSYVLRFSAIGFQAAYSDSFQVPASDFSRDFGSVALPAEVTMLNEVMVESWRPRIEMEAGKMIVRVEGTAMAAGSSAYEIVSKSPGISADQEGNLRLNGRPGVEIMINDRLTYLSAEQLMVLLESMPAENVKNIELIPHPTARYDAEGAAGIINIELKDNVALGFNGSVYGGMEFNKENWYNGGLTLNYNKGRWNTYFSADVSRRGFIREQEVFRDFTHESEFDYYYQNGDQLITRWIPSFRAGADYRLNEKHSFGFIANYSSFDETGNWNTQTQMGRTGESDVLEIAARNSTEEDYGNGRFNLHYEGKLDTLGTRLTADVDYVRLNRNEDSYFRNDYLYTDTGNREREHLYNRSVSGYDILAGKAEFILPLNSRSEMTMGVKASRVISDSDLQFYTGPEGSREFDETRSNSFRYEEEIYAAHGSYSNKLNDHWNVQLGLRAEKTVGTGISPTMGTVKDREYLNLFPNLQVNQKVSGNYEINYSYSKRIDRPSYSKLNPFLFYLDPYTYVVGNPDLEPEIISSYGISQTLFGKYLLMLSYNHTDGVAGEYPMFDEETGQTVLTYANMNELDSYSASLIVPVELASFWNMENTLVVNQTNYDIPYGDENVENDNLYYSLQSNNRIRLPGNIDMELNAQYLGPVAAGVYTLEDRWFVDAGLKRSFIKDRLDVTLKATDIFRGMTIDIYTEYPGSTFAMSQYLYNRGFSINLRYRFNNSKQERESRQSSLEELNRAGG